MTSPRIFIEDNRVWADSPIGLIELQPSHQAFRKRSAWWRSKQGRRVLSRWLMTPGQALAAALKAAPTNRISTGQ